MADLNWTYVARTVPAEGLSVTRTADADERAAISVAFDLFSCERLEVRFVVRPQPQGRYRVTGSLEANFTQSCVATLEPIQQRLRTDFSRELWPAEALPTATEAEIETLEDEPDAIENGMIDIGRIVVEELVDQIDPYPRRPGATAEWREEDAPEKNNPFAGLRELAARTRGRSDEDAD